MKQYSYNPLLGKGILPVEIVFHPLWWFKNAGITFDEDFFLHPLKRVEAERRMEQVLYERFGKYGLGKNRDKNLPVIGAVHNAAGYILSAMLGCDLVYEESAAPQVVAKNIDNPEIVPKRAFKSSIFRKLENLRDALKTKYGYITGDVNWSGILNLALDLRGSDIFIDMLTRPDEVKAFFNNISIVIERFVNGIVSDTGTSSISVNRNVVNFAKPVYLHSECSNTMISNNDYEEFILPIDKLWSEKFRPFGVHHCGSDPHRFVKEYSEIKNLDFLDVGWGGDIRLLREHLPDTFLNIRLSPVEIINQSVDEIKNTVTALVKQSDNPYLTGVCCINADDKVDDSKIAAIFEAVNSLRNIVYSDVK